MDALTPLQDKIQSPNDIAALFQPLRGKYPLVTTNGCFDLLHLGHLKLLAHCASLSPYVVVLLNDDAAVKKLKGPSRPLQDKKSRSLIMASLSFVWRVSIFKEDTPLETLKILQPDIHVKGADYTDKKIPEENYMQSIGGKMDFFRLEPGISTSELIKKITGGTPSS